MKKQSPVGRIWELGEKEHGKLITAVILAVIGVACGMVPYFSAAKIIVLLLSGETTFTAYLPWLLTALGGFIIRTVLYNGALGISHKATFTCVLGGVFCRIVQQCGGACADRRRVRYRAAAAGGGL